MFEIDGEEWYTAKEATERLTKNSGRKVSADYIRRLSFEKKVRSKAYGLRDRLYNKYDVDAYTVEPRGAKAVRSGNLTRWKRPE